MADLNINFRNVPLPQAPHRHAGNDDAPAHVDRHDHHDHEHHPHHHHEHDKHQGHGGDWAQEAREHMGPRGGGAPVPAPPVAGDDLAEMMAALQGLGDRVAALEANRNPAVGQIKDALNGLGQRIAQLEGQPAGGAGPAAARQANGLAVDRQTFPVGPVPLEGYDGGKLNNAAHQTVKYQFGRLASNYPLDGVHDKASAEALLRRMVPDLQAAGLNVKDVKGDKIMVATELGDEWVDVVRGAGAPNPGWWWGSEGKAIPGTEKGPGGAPVQPGGPAAGEPGTPLRTVPLTAAMKAAADQILAGNPGLKNNPGELTKAVAAFVKSTRPDLMPQGDDRPAMYKCMTEVIGILRSMGVEAFRVVNHPARPEGDPGRYGSDAVVINGQIFDVYRAFGEANEPVNQNVGPWNQERAKGLRE